MIKKLFVVTALMALVLSGCGGGQAATETAALAVSESPVATSLVSITEAPVITDTSAPTADTSATATSSTPVTAAPTIGTLQPTNAPDCTNSASFVADVTIPDNTNVAGGTTFTKTWRVSNTGTCTWGPGYSLVHYSDETLGAPASVPLPITAPGQTADISVDFTAPNSNGTHRGNFVIKNPAGLIMKIGDDSRLWVIINVTVTTAITPTATATALANTANAATATLAVTVTGTPPTSTATSSSSSANITTANCAFTTNREKLTQVITAVNAYRAQRGLPAYTVNAQLAQAAQRHANDIACHKLYSHTGSDGSTPQTRVKDTGYIAKSVSENVNGNYPPLDGQGAVNWWINDKTDLRHGQNLLSTTFKEIGVGYSFFDNYGFYALVFAQP